MAESASNGYVVVEFLTESLGPDRVRVHGVFQSAEEAQRHVPFGRATRALKVARLDALFVPAEEDDQPAAPDAPFVPAEGDG